MSTPTRPANEELRLTPQNPWPGLAAFTAANREFFYGRETEIAEIFRRVRRQMLTVLFGVSGLGKTSLLQAGLLPKLGGTPFHPILIRLDHSPEAEDLIEQVRAAITREVPVAIQNGIKVPRAPEKGEDLWGYFHDKTTDWCNAKGDVVSPALVFDQFEEMFTRETNTRELEERKQRFMELLACLVENRPPDELARGKESDAELSSRFDFRQDDYRVVISLREDFLAHLEGFKHRMPSVMENRMRLKPMTEEQALQAVTGPGREIVEEPVAREIVAFVAGKARGTQPTSEASSAAFDSAAPAEADPVLLSLVCDQLNRRRRERKQELITADLLTEEREGIIQEFYERAFEGLDPKVRVWVEDELLTASGYRNRAAQEDALHAGLPATALDELVSGRILHREERGAVVWLELTHDLLTGPAASSRKAREQRLQAEAAAERERALEVERDAQRRKARRQTRISRSLALALLVVIALGWWMWDGNVRVHTKHFNTFAKRWGFFEGVGQLTDAQVSHRKVSYRFIYKGRRGPLQRVQAVDAQGRLTTKHNLGTYLRYASEDENPERECQWEFIRDGRGRVVYEMALDRDTNLVWGFVYSPATTNEFSRRAHFVGPTGMAQAQRNSSAEYVAFTYNADGFESQVLFQDHLGQPQSGPDGQYGEAREYDARGLVKRKTSLTAAGNPMVDNAGNSTLDIEYDALGADVKLTALVLTNLTAPGRPVMLKSGFHQAVYVNDEFGNCIEQKYFDLQGKPVLLREGYARVESQYDNHGNVITKLFFDAEGKPTLDVSNHKHRLTMSYDERGNMTNWVMFDTTGRPAVTESGFGQVVSRFNERDQEIEKAYLDSAGKLVRVTGGYARLTRRFDDRGRVIEEAYFDEAGRPRGGAARYARRTFAYDERGNVTNEAFFDAVGKPMRGANNFASMTASYDERGNRIEEAYFDESGQPVRHKNGYAKLVKRYDARGNAIEESNFDENGGAIRIEDGYSRRTMRYDERNNKIEEAYFNEQGQPVASAEGYTRKALAYDERGNVVEEAYLDKTDKGNAMEANTANGDARLGSSGGGPIGRAFRLNGQLVNSKSGYARVVTRYDDSDKWIEAQYFDIYGNLRAPGDGVATVRARYDARRQQIEQSAFDDAGKPMNFSGGFARLTKGFDERGNQTERACFNVEGQPTLEKSTGAHKWVKSFDHRGNWTNWLYLGLDGKPIMGSNGLARAVSRHDERGNQIEWAGFDERDQPVRRTGGYAKIAYQYDDQDNQIELAYFDTTNQPVRITSGYARLSSRYNAGGKRTEMIYLDETGQVIALPSGLARTISKYDERGNETEWGCYNAAGRPVLHRDFKFHKWAKSFDPSGRWTNLVYLDVEGGLINSDDGFARQIALYNARGNMIETAYFDATGRYVAGTNGYARLLAKYDERGNQVDQAYYNAAGQPARGPNNYARYSARYDRLGRRLDATYYYEPGNPTRVKNGFARVTIRYDDRGNQIQWACFDDTGRPVPDQSDGVHMLENSYDEWGRRIGKAYLGTSGQLLMTTNGYARLEYKYDAAGNVSESYYYDERNEPVHSGEFFSREVARYDDRGRKIESTCYWETESSIWIKRGYARSVRNYDTRGNVTQWACFDTNGVPTIDLEMGNHSFKRDYDHRGYYTNVTYYDVAGRMVVTSNGYARTEIRRDLLGNEVEEFYFDADNQPVHTGGYAWRETTEYNSAGKRIASSQYFMSNSPVRLKNGYAQSSRTYDAQGYQVQWACFDAHGQPTVDRTMGNHMWRKKFDSRGNATNMVYLDVNLKPVVTTNGYAEFRSSYDRRGKLLTWACFGAAGQPVLDPSDGVHLSKKEYDERGNWTNAVSFGVNGEFIRNSNGYARATARYDARDNQIDWAVFDETGKPTLGPDGYARVTARYNELSELVDLDYYDAEGQVLIRRPVVLTVAPGGQGAALGLQPGDVILSYGGFEVSTPNEMTRRVSVPGTELRELKFRRAGQVLVLKVKPGLLNVTLGIRYERPAPSGGTS